MTDKSTIITLKDLYQKWSKRKFMDYDEKSEAQLNELLEDCSSLLKELFEYSPIKICSATHDNFNFQWIMQNTQTKQYVCIKMHMPRFSIDINMFNCIKYKSMANSKDLSNKREHSCTIKNIKKRVMRITTPISNDDLIDLIETNNTLVDSVKALEKNIESLSKALSNEISNRKASDEYTAETLKLTQKAAVSAHNRLRVTDPWYYDHNNIDHN